MEDFTKIVEELKESNTVNIYASNALVKAGDTRFNMCLGKLKNTNKPLKVKFYLADEFDQSITLRYRIDSSQFRQSLIGWSIKAYTPDEDARNRRIPSMKAPYDFMLFINDHRPFTVRDYKDVYFAYYKQYIKIYNLNGIDYVEVNYLDSHFRCKLSHFENRLTIAYLGFIRDTYTTLLLAESGRFDEVKTSTNQDVQDKMDLTVEYGGRVFGIDFYYDKYNRSKKKGNVIDEYGTKRYINPDPTKPTIFSVNIFNFDFDRCGDYHLPPEDIAQYIEEKCSNELHNLT